MLFLAVSHLFSDLQFRCHCPSKRFLGPYLMWFCVCWWWSWILDFPGPGYDGLYRQRSGTFCPIKSEVPALATSCLTLQPERAAEQHTESTVCMLLSERTLLRTGTQEELMSLTPARKKHINHTYTAEKNKKQKWKYCIWWLYKYSIFYYLVFFFYHCTEWLPRGLHTFYEFSIHYDNY